MRQQSRREIIEHLDNIAKASQDLNLSDHATTALWNAIEILKDLKVAIREERKLGHPIDGFFYNKVLD